MIDVKHNVSTMAQPTDKHKCGLLTTGISIVLRCEEAQGVQIRVHVQSAVHVLRQRAIDARGYGATHSAISRICTSTLHALIDSFLLPTYSSEERRS